MHDLGRAKAAVSVTGVATAGALVVRGVAVVAAGWRDAAAAGPVGRVGVPVAGLKAECNELRRHVIEGHCAIVHLSAITWVLGIVRGAADGVRAIDGWQKRQVAAGVIHQTTAESHRVLIFVEPGAEIGHCADEHLLWLPVGAVVAVYAAAIG